MRFPTTAALCGGLALAVAGCTERPLTPSETAFLGSVHGDAVAFDQVVIHKGGLPDVLPRGDALTVDHDIYYKKEEYSEDFTKPRDDGVTYLRDRSLLAHEVTHIWQYTSGKTPQCTVAALLDEQRTYGDQVYVYPKPLDPKRAFTSYRCEQQGQIVQDWVEKRMLNAPDAKVYEAVIRAAIPLDDLEKLTKVQLARDEEGL